MAFERLTGLGTRLVGSWEELRERVGRRLHRLERVSDSQSQAIEFGPVPGSLVALTVNFGVPRVVPMSFRLVAVDVYSDASASPTSINFDILEFDLGTTTAALTADQVHLSGYSYTTKPSTFTQNDYRRSRVTLVVNAAGDATDWWGVIWVRPLSNPELTP